MLNFLGKNWKWILSMIAATVITTLVIIFYNTIREWIQANWFIFPIMTIPAFSAGVFATSLTMRRIISGLRSGNKERFDINMGELAVIDITDKSRDNLWLHGVLFILSIAVIILLIILI
jgi:predicted membrane channel-forming protein YqfA (hemolysin III family)